MKTALVLSAGGMFGSWQVGAWRALSRRFRPDMVIGASVGALNGWAIAGGAAHDELAAAWLDGDTADLLRPRFGLTLFDPEPLRRTARMMFERYRPSIPFACTVVELPRLRPRLLRGEEMTWRHLQAACAIPVGLPPVRLDGRWFVDGGLLGALPLWAAAELGADQAIALDSLPEMPSRLVRAGARLARRIGSPRSAPIGFPVTILRPLRPLGGLRDVVRWNRENVRRWIEQGEHDANSTEL